MPLKGSCHCGKIKYEAKVSPTEAMSCNCSICRRKGSVLFFTTPDNFAPAIDSRRDHGLYVQEPHHPSSILQDMRMRAIRGRDLAGRQCDCRHQPALRKGSRSREYQDQRIRRGKFAVSDPHRAPGRRPARCRAHADDGSVPFPRCAGPG
jgi:hypothetical protein